MKIKKVAIIGLGYVGLPTFVAIAKTHKYITVGYSTNSQKVNDIINKRSPIEDKDVQSFLEKTPVDISDDKNIVKDADVFIICVPTPIYDDYTPDYSFILSAIDTVSPFLKKGCHIVLESTVNPGTCREIILPYLESKSPLIAGQDYNIAHCPERINPGDKKWNIYNIPRNIGSTNKRFNKIIANFYRSFIPAATIHEVSSLEIAEATKIVENTFRDINIAYVNELAKSFDAMEINLRETLIAASNKPFGFLAHWPGCGVGGHCIAVDPYYLIDHAEKKGFIHHFLKSAREINNSMPEYAVQKLVMALNELKKPVNGTKIALLGLSYKPNIGDTRESPAVMIQTKLEALGAKLTVYDPYVKTNIHSLEEAISNATAIFLATGHDEFKNKLPTLLKKSSIKIFIDGRNVFSKEQFDNTNILYKGIGQ